MIKKITKFNAILIVIVLLVVLLPLHKVSADIFSIGTIADTAVQGVATFINKLILQFLGQAISFFAQLLESFINYQTTQGTYNVKVVDDSWTIVRNFVNLFFILILIVMAFGTIFDIKQYTWQEMLPSFIIAALLINFSLTIGQYIITVANGLSGVFLRQIESAGGLTGNLMNGLGAVREAAGGSSNVIASLATAADSAGSVAINLIFSIIFFVGIVLAFASAAIFSIARLFMLWFLLIISPIAWLGYALPSKRGETFSKWWEQFLCWCFFLPYYLFFMMFAVIFVKSKGSIPQLPGSTGIAGQTANDFMFYALSLLFLFGGLIMARRLACASGSGVKTAFGAIETGIRKYAPGAAYIRGAGQGLKDRGEKIAEKGVFGIGGGQQARIQEAEARGLVAGGRPGMTAEKERARATEIEKEFKTLQQLNLNSTDLNKRLSTAKGLEKIAAFKLKAENGWLAPTDLDEINKMLREVGGGRSASGASIIASLKKGKFHEMAVSTAEKEAIFGGLEDGEIKKTFGLDMAESRELMNAGTAKILLDLYSGDTLEVRKKVEEAIKNNIENIARDQASRRDLLNAMGAYTGADARIRKLAGQIMVEKKEVGDWKTRNQIIELNGGVDASGIARTVEGRGFAKEMSDGNVGVKEEESYRKSRPGISPLADLTLTQRAELENQVVDNINNGQIRNLNTEDLKSPAVFNALFNGKAAGALTPVVFNKALGLVVGSGGALEIKGKPDRKKRKAINDLLTATSPIPYP